MRRFTLTAMGAALLCAVTACGGTAETAAPAGTTLPAPFTDTAQLANAATAAAQRAKVARVDFLAPGNAADATGHLNGAGLDLTETDPSKGTQTEFTLVDGSLYVQPPADQAKSLGLTTPWGKLPAGAGDQNAVLAAYGQLIKECTLADTLSMIGKAGKIVKSEQITLNNVPVRHYFLELDPSRAPEQFATWVPPKARADLAAQLKGKNVAVPVELWLDKDQLPAKVVIDNGDLAKALGDDSGGKTAVTYREWGTPAEIAAPPAGQVTDLTKLLSGH